MFFFVWLFTYCNEGRVKLLFADRVELSDGQITRQGFLQLNQMEAEDNDEDLWITLSTMGYNNALVMDEVQPAFYYWHSHESYLDSGDNNNCTNYI